MGCRRSVSNNCTECGLCEQECLFLKTYGNPKAIADAFDPDDKDHLTRAFECSLCGLCTAICPEGVDPSAMFLEMRREAVRRGCGNYPEHSAILKFEQRGTSRRYTWYGLPEGCDTVFFPGCNLPGTRPQRVRQVYQHLRQAIPTLGIIFDCCTNPSHDLGREDFFGAVFGEMLDWIRTNGVRTVLVACPNCHQVFRQYGEGLLVKSIYEALNDHPLPCTKRHSGVVTIHDPCAVRFEGLVQEAARHLTEALGVTIAGMTHERDKTVCCGQGGAVGLLAPHLVQSWRSIRKKETEGRRIVTYCGGCAGFLGAFTPTSHILDLVFDPEATLGGNEEVSVAPVTYWNRIRLKATFKRMLASAHVKRERPSMG